MSLVAYRRQVQDIRKGLGKMALKKAIKSVHEKTWEAIDSDLAKYGASREHLTTHHLEKIDRILDADDLTVAEELGRRAYNAVFIYLMNLWGKKKIVPNTIEALEKQAKSAESFAKWREKEGDLEAAERQMKRAEELRAKAAELRMPSVEEHEVIEVVESSPPPLPAATTKKAKTRKPTKRKKKG